MKIIFFGSPSYSCRVLESLLSSTNIVQAVITQNFKNNRVAKTPVGLFGESKNINTLYPEDLSDIKLFDILQSYNADLYIIYAYGKILPSEIIALPKYGVINIHWSILPKWRGAAPIQRALQNGDSKTGVTFFKVDESLDTGAIISSHEYQIKDTDDSLALQDKLTQIAINKLEDAIELNLKASNFIDQKNLNASYAKKIQKSEAIINWHDSAEQIIRNIKALTGWPVAETELFEVRLKIWKGTAVEYNGSDSPGSIIKFNRDELCIVAGDGAVSIEKLQLPGKKVITARDLFNSNSSFVHKIKQYLGK